MPFCGNCGRAHLEGHRFCEQCGAPLAGGAAAPGGRTRAPWVPRTADARGRPYSAGRLEGGWEFATFGQRFGAWLIDLVVVLTASGALAALENATLGEPFVSPIIGLLYHWGADSFGKSLGKAALGIEIVSHEWGRPGLGRGLIRTLISFVSALTLGLGYLSVLWDDEHRAWHDHAADVWVIKRDRR